MENNIICPYIECENCLKIAWCISCKMKVLYYCLRDVVGYACASLSLPKFSTCAQSWRSTSQENISVKEKIMQV